MSEVKLGVDDAIVFNGLAGFQLYNKAKQSLSFGAWKGNISITVFGDNRPVLRQPMSLHALVSLSVACKKLIPASPGTAETITFTKYDVPTKTRAPIGRIVISKSEENVYVLTIKTAESDTVTFEIMSPGSITLGENNTKADRSNIGIRSLITVLDVVCPQAMVLSKRKFVPSGGGNGGNFSGGGGSSVPEKDIAF